jgi:hypothetical protein
LSTLVTFATSSQDAGGDVAPKQRRPLAISARKGRQRGTPPIDIPPKRELYIGHTVTSNHRRSRAEQRQHMRDLEQVQRPSRPARRLSGMQRLQAVRGSRPAAVPTGGGSLWGVRSQPAPAGGGCRAGVRWRYL